MGDWLSAYWVAPLVAWLVAQVAKIFVALVKGEYQGSRPTLISSGNMPSSHSAITMALVTSIALERGINTPEFGLAFVFTSIVIYDALNVRRAVGEQGMLLKTLLKDKVFFSALGHNPLEVAVGALVGVAVALVTLQIL